MEEGLMSVLHETKLEHAHDAALELTSDDLSEPVRSSLIWILSQAYTAGEDLPEDGSGAERIAETLVLISQARHFLDAVLNFNEVTQKTKELQRKILEAESAVWKFGAETVKGL